MIGLMDCNNFFVSCERLFRPDLLGKPVAVLSSNDGCIVARSQEVKDLGIQMGAPYFQVKDICEKNKVTLFSSNFSLYRDISSRVMRTLKEDFDLCEVYSVDEAFFQLDSHVCEKDLQEARNQIIQKTGIPVSIGVGSTKTRAKLASTIAKKGGGVCILDDALMELVESEIPCGRVWGIGAKTSSFLSKNKIFTVKDFKGQNMSFIKNNLGISGERLYMELSGTPVYSVGNHVCEPQESYMSTRSFGTKVKDKTILQSALSYHVKVIAERLRKDEVMTAQMTILVRGSRFGDFSHRPGSLTAILATPTNDTVTLIKEAFKLLDSLFDSEIPYKKAGVVLGAIVPVNYVQESLFIKDELEDKRKGLDLVTDCLNEKFGNGTIVPATLISPKTWQERLQRRSPDYTTNWKEIPVIWAR